MADEDEYVWGFSDNGEWYHVPYKSREDAIEQAKKELLHPAWDRGPVKIHVAKLRLVDPGELAPEGNTIVEAMAERAYDLAGEAGSDWMSDVTGEQEHLLTEYIQKAVRKWFREEGIAFKVYAVIPETVEEVEIVFGQRVGALMSIKDGVAYLYGYGLYEGDFMREESEPQAEGFVAEVSRDLGRPNPRIRLDNGQVVWGCECWWGDERVVRQKVEGLKVEHIDINEKRRKLREQKESP